MAACLAAAATMATAGAQEYRCHSSGERYVQGEVACVRGKVARCDMYLNNSAWKFQDETCIPGTNPRVWTPRPRGDVTPPDESER